MAESYKRKYPRLNSMNLAEVHIMDDRGIADCGIGRTLNISESGILLETHFPIEEDQVLDLSLALGEEILEIRGKVVYSRKNSNGKYQNGVQFTEYDESAIPILKSFIERSDGVEDIQKILL